MKISIVCSLFLALGVSMLCGCDSTNDECSCPTPEPATDRAAVAVMTAKYTAEPVVIDGILDEPLWQEAAIYDMQLSVDRSKNNELEEAAQVRLAWDEKYFYVGVKFDDSDIVAEGKTDQLHHYKFGDVCELFLKPTDKTWYWELYATPRGKKTSFFFPSQGRFGLPSCFEDIESDLQVGAQCEGTLNNWQDKDGHWTAEMAMPIKSLTAKGEKFGPGADWRILVARYNYSYYRTKMGPELSATPRLSVTNYHLIDEYAVLKLAK